MTTPPSGFDADAAQRFLQALFDFAPPETRGMLWSNPGRESHWFPAIEEGCSSALHYAERHTGKRDVYVGTYLTGQSFGPKSRGTEADVRALLGVHVDVDVADPTGTVHKKPNLPPTFEDAKALINEIGAPPTLLVYSGHGLQAWWLFREPWLLETPEERAMAKVSLELWQGSLRTLAGRHGWTIDSTGDLVRVLRLPGTVNVKDPKHPVPVLLLKDDGPRWEPSDLEEYLISDEPAPAPVLKPAIISSTRKPAEKASQNGKLVLRSDADPPFTKFEALKQIEPRFLQSWEHTRRDKEFKDKTVSGYDFSLVNFAVQAGWSEQEIANLIIAHRRKWGDGLDKALREDYHLRTIERVRQDMAQRQADEDLDDVVAAMGFSAESGDPAQIAQSRSALLSTVAGMWGVPVTGFQKLMSEPPEYRLLTARGSVDIGKAEALLSHTAMSARVADACRKVLPKFDDKRWRNLIQALLTAAEEVSGGKDATVRGQAHTWVDAYLSEKKPVTIDELEESDTEGYGYQKPFVKKDGTVWIFGDPFRQWLATSRGEKLSGIGMGKALRALGAEDSQLGVTLRDGRRSTRGVWRLPSSFAEDWQQGVNGQHGMNGKGGDV